MNKLKDNIQFQKEFKKGLDFLLKGELRAINLNQECLCGCGRICDKEHYLGTRDLGFPYYTKECLEQTEMDAKFEAIYNQFFLTF